MSTQKLQSLSRFLTIGTAAFLIQFGGVAVAGQQPDIQQQMQQVLSGHIEAHVASHAQASRDDASRGDAQAFAQRLLQGWSTSAVAGARSAQAGHGTAHSKKYADVQAMVRRQLLGV